ncbi:SDR family oxidoreductase [Orrella daihaiensis]|uniref:SDR family oxidoreductase n=1 Tax=Orrella daihaiensis TaxID=2782176 RepID=A0ABY4APD4_9BURK|nr:SDR family oxidoreductase [Orrella daihaiensis]UOD49924.1 SDR family oxidoreductase [Orrella daihaiensis]
MAVFITGASSGIGQALARQYASQGHVLGLVARRSDRLDEMARNLRSEVHIYAVDVRHRAALHAAAQDFVAKVGHVDIVIANAGVSAGTLTECDEDFEVFKDIFDINLLAMVSTFEPFVPIMTKHGQGTLVGISSVAGVRGLPGAGAYSASKSAVTTYCESLRLELKPKGIDVVTIAPGYVKSEMTAKNPYSMPFLLDADEFARRAVRAVAAKRRYAVIPWQMAIVSRLMKLLPVWLYDRLAMNAPRKPRRPT